MPTAYRLTGQLNITALEQSLNEIIRRHEVLRTTFPSVDRQPSQAIASTITLTLPLIDLRDHPEKETLTQQLANEEAQRPFNLATEPLFRVQLLRLAETEYVLLLNMHHIVSDGWSFNVFFQELAALYTAFSTNKPSPLPSLPIQYADFTHWQHEWLQGEVLESQLNYWKQQLKGSLPILQLPADYPRPPVQTYQGAYQSLELSLDLAEALKALSQQESVTLFMTLLAAFQTLLSRYSGQEDIIVGTPIAGRNQVQTEQLIGFFVNTLALRTNLSGNPSFRQLLHQVREVTLGAYDHQDLPLEKLIEELQPERDLSRSPLFQVMFVFQNTPRQPWELPGLSITPLEVHSGTSKFDLTLNLRETSEGVKGGIGYNTDLFEAATIDRMLGHFQILLESIVANPEQHLWDLPLLTADEQHQLLVEWNNTQTNYPNDTCIHQLFEAQVERTPNAIAVVFENEQLTYQQLNHRANQLTHHLQKLGVKPEVTVGICLERSLEMLVALLAILKAGGAYIPLDSTYPTERLAFMLQNSQVSLLLTTSKIAQHSLYASGKASPNRIDSNEQSPINPEQLTVISLDKTWETINQENPENPQSHITPTNLACILYTSGSTGFPKGVAIEHRSTVNFIHWAQTVFNPSQLAGVLASTSICFDLSVFELFVPLSCGGKVILTENALHLPTLKAAPEVTLINTVPSAIAELLRANAIPQNVQTVNLAGEPLSQELVNQLYQQETIQQVFNLYGPSEATTYSTFTISVPRRGENEKARHSPSIGRPIANTQIYILDSHLQPVPIGVPGELHIGGVGLARCYLNRSELTEEKFIPNPFQRSNGAGEQRSKGAKEDPSSNPERLYKTGDLARYLPDGTIEFLGRLDNQVKIRGFRIELGDIEAAITQHSNVQQTVVTAREDSPGDKRLVAYIVLSPEQTLTPDELRRFLKQKLPDYMMPSAFVFLDALPLTPNGKVDRRALPAPEQARQEPEETFVAPRNELELQLATIWEKVLGKKPISVKDNFFDLGGHSLLAVRLFADIEKTFHKQLPLATLFQAPTIEQLARILHSPEQPAIWDSLVQIKSGTAKQPLFLVHDADGETLLYLNLARYLDAERPVYGLRPHSQDGYPILHTRIAEMVAHYIEKIRTIQPEGPYLLGGLCAGGVLAFEVARQLQAWGQRVALVALLDTADVEAPRKIGRITHQRLTRFSNALNHNQHLQPQEQLTYILQTVTRKVKNLIVYELRTQVKHIQKKFKVMLYRYYLDKGFPLPEFLRNIPVRTLYRFAVQEYIPQVFQGRVTLFRATEAIIMDEPSIDDTPVINVTSDPLFGWGKRATSGVEVYDVPGGHSSSLQEPYVQVLAEKLQACINAALSDDSRHCSARRENELGRSQIDV
jgi:aspartate racemase